MFVTESNAEIFLPPIFGDDDGEKHWAYVKFVLHVPWFYLTYAVQVENDVALRHMLLLSDIEQVVEVAQSPAATITEVAIVIPAHMNGRDRWIMEGLAEVWRGNDPEWGNQVVNVYVTDSGERYHFPGTSRAEPNLVNFSRIYPEKSPVAK